MAEKPTPIDFLECYQAVYNDWLAYHPDDLPETVRDMKRIALGIKSRGSAFYTTDLPAISKVLTRALDERRLRRTGLPGMAATSRTAIIPRLFRGFWSRLFGPDGHLLCEVDPNVVFFLQVLLNLSGKLKLAAPPKSVNQTLTEFYHDDQSLPPLSPFWRGESSSCDRVRSLSDFTGRQGQGLEDVLLHSERNGVGSRSTRGNPSGRRDTEPEANSPSNDGTVDFRRVAEACQYMADVASTALGYFSGSDVWPSHGPGAVAEKLSGSDKFSFPIWPPQLERHFPFGEFGTYAPDSYLSGSRPSHHHPRIEVGASRLIAVPKTQKAPRLIAAEPTANQWIQQGVSRLVRDRVAACFLGRSINFFDQRPSQDAALLASLDGEHATIDLKSASDLLSCAVIERVFRRNLTLLDMLYATRTPYLVNETWERYPKLIELRKFATMGSALTFPIQSIVFTILALGVGSYLTGRDGRELVSDVRVFGDDIVVPVGWYPTLRVLLEGLGLKVNNTKSFAEGNFRESCGVDAYNGYNVTPVRLRQPSIALATREALGFLDTVNNLWMQGLWHTSKALERMATFSNKIEVVNRSARAYGLATFCKGFNPAWIKKTRWNKDLQRWEVKVHTVKPVAATYDRTSGWNDLSEFFFRKERRDHYSLEQRGSVADDTEPTLYTGVQLRSIKASARRAIVRPAWVALTALTGGSSPGV